LNHDTNSIRIFDPDEEMYRRFVPDNLVELFERVFLEKKPFSVELLMQELEIALKAVRDVPGKDFSYLDIMKKYRADSQKENTYESAPEFAVHGDSASSCDDSTMDLEDIFIMPPDVHTAAVYDEYMHPKQTKQEIVINTDSDDTNTPQTLETAGSGWRKVLPRKLMRTLAVILCAVLCLVVADIVKYTNITEYIHDRIAIISQLWETVVIWFETKIDLINTMLS
jgi:hypothetical protein